jgi:hypothetical protein
MRTMDDDDVFRINENDPVGDLDDDTDETRTNVEFRNQRKKGAYRRQKTD